MRSRIDTGAPLNILSHSDHITPDQLADLRQCTPLERCVHLHETASTNTVALDLLRDASPAAPLKQPALPTHPALPALVYAERQVAGRGRGGNQWQSSRGSLTFTLLEDFARVGLPLSQHPAASLITALAVADACESMLPCTAVQVKWPNDVYVGERKLAGILIESAASQPNVHVIGIGINVNNAIDAADESVRQLAISMAGIVGFDLDRYPPAPHDRARLV